MEHSKVTMMLFTRDWDGWRIYFFYSDSFHRNSVRLLYFSRGYSFQARPRFEPAYHSGININRFHKRIVPMEKCVCENEVKLVFGSYLENLFFQEGFMMWYFFLYLSHQQITQQELVTFFIDLHSWLSLMLTFPLILFSF